MLDSLYTGTAGIKANSTALGIVGANIANVNTVGYKTANTSFQNVLSTAMGSGRLGSKEVWNQGSLEQTAVTTDFAIVGEGLFQLEDAAGGTYYTRDGSFNLDENGFLTNTAGMKVQGFKIGNGGEVGTAGDIQIANVNSSPRATEEMGLDFNLDGQYRAASVMVDCTDNFSSITYTARTPGENGNDTSVRYIDSGSGGPVVSSEGSLLTIDMGGRDLTAAQAAAMVNAYFNVAAETGIGVGDASVQFVANEAGGAGNDIQVKYCAGVALDVAVTESSGIKTVTVTVVAGTTTGAQVAEAVNSDVEASALITGISKGKGTGVVCKQAALTIGEGDAAVVFEAIPAGSDGNDITINYAKSGNNTALAVNVANDDEITVTLATDASGNVTSTAADIVAAVNAHAEAKLLVAAAGTGTTSVANEAVPAANLTGGSFGVAYAAKTIGEGDAAVEFQAKESGPSGNDITINYAKSGNNTALAVTVADDAITVTLATDGSGDVTSTAADIVAAVNAHAEAKLLVAAAGTGTASVANESVSATHLTGGDVASLETGENYLLNGSASKNMGEDDAAVLFVANKAGSDGNGIQIEYVKGTELKVSVASNTITVALEEGCSALDIAALVNEDADASALVTAYAGGSGEVPYEVVSATSLENGVSSSTIPAGQVSAIASGDGSGLIEVSAPVTLSDGSEPEDYSTTIGVYDSLGNEIDLTVDYIFNPVLEMGEDGNLNTVSQWFWSVRSSEGNVNDINGILRFDSSGQLDRVKSNWTDVSGKTESLRNGGNPKIIVTDLNSGAADLSVEWDLSITTNVSGFSGLSEVTGQSQDGYASGSLTELSVDEEGVISGTFSNGATRDLYQVGVASFQNYEGLALKGTNIFKATEASGAAMFAGAGSGGRGSISAESLELSNVDLADEFVNMITIQRAYQANSRVITTSSDILQELINLKR